MRTSKEAVEHVEAVQWCTAAASPQDQAQAFFQMVDLSLHSLGAPRVASCGPCARYLMRSATDCDWHFKLKLPAGPTAGQSSSNIFASSVNHVYLGQLVLQQVPSSRLTSPSRPSLASASRSASELRQHAADSIGSPGARGRGLDGVGIPCGTYECTHFELRRAGAWAGRSSS